MWGGGRPPSPYGLAANAGMSPPSFTLYGPNGNNDKVVMWQCKHRDMVTITLSPDFKVISDRDPPLDPVILHPLVDYNPQVVREVLSVVKHFKNYKRN